MDKSLRLERADSLSGQPPDRVWMHNSLGYWFSVADECREDGDVEYTRADSALVVDSTIVEILGPDDKVHYHRPWNDPDVQEAFNTRGYSVRKAQGPGDVSGITTAPKNSPASNS